MLSKKYRLPSFLIPETLKKGRRFYSKSFVLVTIHHPPSTNHHPPRFAFIISKKTQKLAVKRNRIKRLLREAAYFNLKKIKDGYNIILIVRKSQGLNKLEQIKIEFMNLFQKAGLIK